MTRLQDPGEIGRTIQRARRARGLTQRQLADAAGLTQTQISLYEGGRRIPRPGTLESIVAALGLTLPQFERLRSVPLAAAAPPASTPPVGAVGDLAAEVVRAVSDAVLLALGDALREPVGSEAQDVPRAAERAAAPALWARLVTREPAVRRLLIEGAEEYRSWALAELVCEESARAAADAPDRALELAELARYIAERSLGAESWRLYLQGYAWAFMGNARRVGSDLRGAEQAFAQARVLWETGTAADPGVLDTSRVLDLEASFRRAQRRFPEALALLDRALEASPSPARAGSILLNKAGTCEQMGDCEGAIAALERAAPLVDGAGEPRQLFGLRFNLAVNLCHLGRYAEAAPLAAEARELAIALRNDLDLVRVLWLEGRVAAGLGRPAEAIAALRQVRDDFAARGVSYDAALATLDLAVLLLEEGHGADVRALAPEMGPIFESLDVYREALAALRLFWRAVEQEQATAELGRRLLRFLERARYDPELRFDGGDRRSRR